MSTPGNRGTFPITDVFPPIPKVERLVVSKPSPASEDGVDLWIWLRSLQGLVNRVEPHLYLIRETGALGSAIESPLYEEHWLEYYRRSFSLPTENADDIDGLLERYSDVVDGYVLYDDTSVIQTQNLAITLAGLEKTLPIAPGQERWMKRHGIQRRNDLRGRFKSDYQAARWAVENLWPRCYRRLYANFCVHRPSWYALSHELEDFIVYHRGMALDLPLSRQTRETLYLYREMMEQAEAPGVQMNWHCVMDQEKEYIAEAATYGFFSLCSVASPNLTIHGGVGDQDAAYTQPLPDAAECHAEPEKVYVCLYNSDGDATWAMNNLHSGNWNVPQRGAFPFGWGFLPLTVRLMPAMLRYYWETKHPNDTFWGPSSGAAYTYTHMWPDDLVDWYLRESRRLLDQTGQNGCNLVNWNLKDWWREVEDDAAVRREQEAMASGPGLVCGLGGSPYAKNYLDGAVPKLHSAHIANVGRDNIGDIVRLSKECPTRPLFLFLFAQIAEGIWEQLESEMEELGRHPDIVLLGMDQFFLTLTDAVDRGMLPDELYEKTDALAETWLKAPGRHRLPFCVQLSDELAEVAAAPEGERRERLARGGWIDLVSREIEHVAVDSESFRTAYSWRDAIDPSWEADTLLYVAFTVAWTLVRSSLEAQGVYANNRFQALDTFRQRCGSIVDLAPFERIFAAWDDWENGPSPISDTVAWCGALAKESRKLDAALGSGEEFDGWMPKPI